MNVNVCNVCMDSNVSTPPLSAPLSGADLIVTIGDEPRKHYTGDFCERHAVIFKCAWAALVEEFNLKVE